MVSSAAFRCLQAAVFLWAYLSTCCSFEYWTFTVYLEAIKTQFHLGQFYVDFLQGLSILGRVSSFPAGVMVQKHGLYFTGAVGLIAGSAGNILVWVVGNADAPGTALIPCFLVAGVGAGISYVMAISACVRYFSESYRATVVGTLSTGANLGPILFTFVYQHWFYGDGSYEGQKLKEYFLFVAISCAACNFCMLLSIAATEVYVQQVNDNSNGVCSGVCEFFKNREMQSADQSTQPVFATPSSSVREYSSMSNTNCTENMGSDFHSEQTNDEDTLCHQQKRPHALSANTLTDPIQYTVESESENTDFDNRLSEPTQRQVLLSARFHLILWPSFILQGLKSMNLGNLTSYLESFGQQQYILWLPYVSPAIAIVWKAVLGLASDRLLNIVPRIWFLIPAATMFTVGYILTLLWLDHLPCLLIVTVLWTCGADVMPGIAPAIMLEDFGLHTFSGNVGLMYAGCSVTAFFSQLWFGAFYDIYVEDGQTVCYGTICYRWSFMVSLALSVTCVTFLALYARFYTKTTNNKNENYKDHFVREIETEDVSSIQ